MTQVLEVPAAEAQVARPWHETLPPSAEVYKNVMAAAEPLRDPTSDRYQRFYGEMGIVPAEPTRLRYDMRGHQVWDKDETRHASGAFKSRGLDNAVLAAKEENPTVTGFIIASAGNAGNGAAIAGKRVGASVTVECAFGVSPTKVEKLHSNDATVHIAHTTLEAGMDHAEAVADGTSVVALHPFDQEAVIAGAVSAEFERLAHLEALHERGEIDLHHDKIKWFVPVGGGGYLTAVACAVRDAKERGVFGDGEGDNVEVWGVQLKGCDAVKRAVDCIRSGVPVPDNLFPDGDFNGRSDGTAVLRPGKLTTAVAADETMVKGILTVAEGDLGEAMTMQSRTYGKNIEPAGALSLAGARAYAAANPTRPRSDNSEILLTTTTGANVSPELFGYFMDAAETARKKKEQQDLAARVGYLIDMRAMPHISSVGAKNTMDGNILNAARRGRGTVLSGPMVRLAK